MKCALVLAALIASPCNAHLSTLMYRMDIMLMTSEEGGTATYPSTETIFDSRSACLAAGPAAITEILSDFRRQERLIGAAFKCTEIT